MTKLPDMGTRRSDRERGGSAGVAFPYIKNWLERLTISQGPRAGELFELLPWQHRFGRGAFRPGVSRSACTCGRGNGKSGLVAAISTLYLAGPLAVPRGEVVVLASSFGQARDAIGEQVLWFLGRNRCVKLAGGSRTTRIASASPHRRAVGFPSWRQTHAGPTAGRA